MMTNIVSYRTLCNLPNTVAQDFHNAATYDEAMAKAREWAEKGRSNVLVRVQNGDAVSYVGVA